MDLEKAKSLVKEIFKDFKKFKKPDIQNHLTINLELKNFLLQYFQNHKEYQTFERFVKALVYDIQLKHCKICGKTLTYSQTLRPIKYCSLKCFAKDQQVNKLREEKKEKTCLERYGAKDVFCLKEYQDKFKQIHLKNYGTEVPAKSKIIKEKTSKIVKKAMKEYGTQHLKEHLLKTIGVDNPLKSQKVKDKRRKTNLEKYGTELPGQKSAYENFSKWKEYVIPLFPLQEYKGYNHIYKWKCVKCGDIFESSINRTTFLKGYSRMPRCKKCFPLHQHFSEPEKELVDFCRQYFPDLKENNRTLIAPYQVDILIEDLKLAIEFNGIHWHAIDKVPKGFHLMKTELCQKKGYRLIHIWQNDWYENKQKIEQKLSKIFIKNQILNYNKYMKLDRCWFQLKQIQGYKLTVLEPEIIEIDKYKVQNCGYILYQKE